MHLSTQPESCQVLARERRKATPQWHANCSPHRRDLGPRIVPLGVHPILGIVGNPARATGRQAMGWQGGSLPLSRSTGTVQPTPSDRQARSAEEDAAKAEHVAEAKRWRV